MSKRLPEYTRCICPFCKKTIYTARGGLHTDMRKKDVRRFYFSRNLIIDAKIKKHFEHCVPYIVSSKKPKEGEELSLCDFVNYTPEHYK